MDPTMVTHTFPPAGMTEPPAPAQTPMTEPPAPAQAPMKAQPAADAPAAVDAMAGAASGPARGPDRTIAEAAATAHRAVDGAASATAPLADWLAAHGGELEAMQKKLLADTCTYVSANPLKAVGIAAAAGFVLSRVMR